MRLPATVGTEVGRALCDLGHDQVTSVSGVSGGCINHGCRIEAGDGGTFFLKWNADAPDGMFAAEVDGLEALRSAASRVDRRWRPVVPEPLAVSEPDAEIAWLLMSWIPQGEPAPESEARSGRGLACLHRAGTLTEGPSGAEKPPGARRPPGVEQPTGVEEPSGIEGPSGVEPLFGWPRDNWIGSLPQSNRRHAAWSDFWRDERIVPQLVMARADGRLAEPVLDRVVDAIPTALAGVEVPELLHGDLWSGNRFVADDGAPALVDPAVYRGDGEVDLAMSELFGGFGPDFYAAYREVRSVSAEYRSHRRDLYQLYYLLVHVNLFGGGYVRRTLQAARRVVAALG